MAKNAFTFKKYNGNSTEVLKGTVPEDFVEGDMIYMDADGVPQLMDDTPNVYGLYIVAEAAAQSATSVVAYPIKHDDEICGKLLVQEYVGIVDTAGDGVGLYDEDDQYLSSAETNEYFVLTGVDTGKKEITSLTETLTVVTGGASLAAGDLFSLDGSSKTTKTLGSTVYVAGDTYASGTSATVKMIAYPCSARLKV